MHKKTTLRIAATLVVGTAAVVTGFVLFHRSSQPMANNQPPAVNSSADVNRAPINTKAAKNANVAAIPQPENTNTATVNSATSNTSLKEITIGNTAKKQIIFTFDAGSGTQSLDKILATLTKHNLTGTFFITGAWATKNGDSVKRISAAGHEIYNHTYTHPHLTQVSDADIASELSRTDTLITQLTGKSTKPYFRPPYGDRNAHVLDIASQAGYRSVYWTTDALDWETGQTADVVESRILSHLKPGAIFLMHVGDDITGQILDDTMTKILAQGYTLVSLSKGL